jgi:hypothetical protein
MRLYLMPVAGATGPRTPFLLDGRATAKPA